MADHQPKKILHLADQHLGRRMGSVLKDGRNLRETDIEQAFLATCEYACETQPDLVVLAGDLFDTANPTPASTQCAIDGLSMMRAAGLTCLTIGGNHDTTINQSRLGPLQLAAQQSATSLVEHHQMRVQIEDLDVVCLPYRAIASGQANLKDAAGSQLLIAHASAHAPGLPSFAAFDHVKLTRPWLEAAPLTLLGHLHIHHQPRPGVFYAGAPERLTWGEMDNTPSVWEHTLHHDGKTSSRSVPVSQLTAGHNPRPAISLKVDASGLGAQQALRAAQDTLQAARLSEAIVRLQVENSGPGLGALGARTTLEQQARRAGAQLIRVDINPRPADQLPEGPSPQLAAGAAGLGEAFRSYAKANKAPTELAALGAALIEKHGKAA